MVAGYVLLPEAGPTLSYPVLLRCYTDWCVHHAPGHSMEADVKVNPTKLEEISMFVQKPYAVSLYTLLKDQNIKNCHRLIELRV